MRTALTVLVLFPLLTGAGEVYQFRCAFTESLIVKVIRDTLAEQNTTATTQKNGNTITVRLSGRAVTSPEVAEQVLEVIAEDVTERRLLEDQFRQAQRMEAVGRLAGGVAHDFNNLLMVISGYTEVLLENTGRNSPLYPKIAAIQQAAERATTLTRQLLAFSRKQLLELKVVDLNTIVREMERLLRPLIGENIELQTRLANDLGRTRADAGQIEQVIMNLASIQKMPCPMAERSPSKAAMCIWEMISGVYTTTFSPVHT